MLIIPTLQGQSYWTQTTTLEGTPYFLEFRFNSREQCWYLQISLTDQTVLCQGVKLVSNYFLLQKYVDQRLPAGELMCVAQGSDDSPAGLNDLGGRVTLLYVAKDEISAGWDAGRL